MNNQLPTTPQLGLEIDRISTALQQADNESIASLPESVFVNNFLPMFSGETVPAHINPGQWAAIAGTPYRPVNIIGADGKVLYQVPPLLVRDRVDPTKTPQGLPRMGHVVATTNQLQLVSPRQADHYLRKELHRRGIVDESSESVQTNVQQWNAIFARYNKPLIGDGALPEEVADFNPQKSEGKADLTYGDDIL